MPQQLYPQHCVHTVVFAAAVSVVAEPAFIVLQFVRVLGGQGRVLSP
jgi:hypothetical protein